MIKAGDTLKLLPPAQGIVKIIEFKQGFWRNTLLVLSSDLQEHSIIGNVEMRHASLLEKNLFDNEVRRKLTWSFGMKNCVVIHKNRAELCKVLGHYFVKGIPHISAKTVSGETFSDRVSRFSSENSRENREFWSNVTGEDDG